METTKMNAGSIYAKCLTLEPIENKVHVIWGISEEIYKLDDYEVHIYRTTGQLLHLPQMEVYKEGKIILQGTIVNAGEKDSEYGYVFWHDDYKNGIIFEEKVAGKKMNLKLTTFDFTQKTISDHE